jgi:hypothetical protein
LRDVSPRKPCGMILPPPAPRNRGRGKRRASPPPAEPSPFGNPHPGTPLHHRNSQRGRALCAHSVAPRGEDAARGRPSPRPSGHGACKPLPLLRSRLPPKGAPRIKRQKDKITANSKDRRQVVSASRLRFATASSPFYSSVTRRAWWCARRAPSHPPAPARERVPPLRSVTRLQSSANSRLPFATAHSPALPSALTGLPGS